MKIDKFIGMVFKSLKCEKLKIAKGNKIPLTPYIEESFNNTIISDLDVLISKEDVKVEEDGEKCSIVSTTKVTDNMYNNKTFVVSLTRKQLNNSFDFLKDSRIGVLLRSSTLSSIYYQVKDLWKKLIDTDKSKTYILYVPKLFVFADLDNMDLFYDKTIFTDLLLVVTPTANDMIDASDKELNNTEMATRVITDTLDAIIKLGKYNVIIEPYSNKIVSSDKYTNGVLWNQIATSKRVDDNINSIIFDLSFVDEEDFNLFINTTNTK